MTNKFLYKVVSKTQVETSYEKKVYYNIERQSMEGEYVCPKKISVILDNANIGDEIEVSFKVVEDKRIPQLYFLHHYDRINQGDVLSGPYNYFSFSKYKFISWDKYIIANEPLSFSSDRDYNVIMGGGIYFPKDKPRLKKLMKNAQKFIGWGIGLDTRIDLSDFISQFDLLGTREKNSSFIDNKKVFYVPCASCMNTFFDRFENSLNISTKELAIHLNHGFNEKEIKKLYKAEDITYTTTDFEESIKNISEAEYVLTNSYHGAYWASLMGKKVICLATKVPKWDGLPPEIEFTDIKNINNAFRNVEKVDNNYLIECRSINNSFYKKVMDLLN